MTRNACAEIQQAFTDVTEKGLQVGPAAAEQTFRDGAAMIRRKAEGTDDDVRGASGRFADAVEKFGRTSLR